jgi:predicted nuclease with TOPRIM domain
MEPTTAIRTEEASFLSELEERIVKAVEVVGSLRKENAALQERLKDVSAGQAETEAALLAAQQESARLQKEVDSLSTERKQVRTRIEKLLTQMDLLSGS